MTVAVPSATYAVYKLMKPDVGRLFDPKESVYSGACPINFIKTLSMARYSARIKELRDLGVVVETQPCLVHTHKRPAVRYMVTGGPVVVLKEKR